MQKKKVLKTFARTENIIYIKWILDIKKKKNIGQAINSLYMYIVFLRYVSALHANVCKTCHSNAPLQSAVPKSKLSELPNYSMWQ